MEDLPKTTSGKVTEKSSLPERKRPELATLYSPAKTVLEKNCCSLGPCTGNRPDRTMTISGGRELF
ncbi:hypothetical protein CS542_10040 [Pedobacter sp. IW39]|nr:hypothetical protein CS542_10040 [Pedobacter sp. IW39]